MKQCERCGKEFDPEEAAETFDNAMGYLSYRDLTKYLCAECAIDMIDEPDQVGLYITTCEECGREFDFVVDREKFWDVPYVKPHPVIYCWDKMRCVDCALAEMEWAKQWYRDRIQKE